MATKVVNVKTDEYDVYVGRKMNNDYYKLEGHVFANPFRTNKEKYREFACSQFEKWMKLNYRLQKEYEIDWELDKLKDKRLACWCHPKRCHADLLAKLADMTYEERMKWANER